MIADDLARQKAAALRADWTTDDQYYDNADSWVGSFWADHTAFRQMFNQLDPGVIVELACGRGRHSWQMKDWPNRKILIDVVPENIAFCQRRFAGVAHVECLANNGVDLAGVATASATALFCYDAMVHFDHVIVLQYLLETARILKPGGRALLHHSNYPGNPGGDYKTNPHWRAFMPGGLFVDYCRKAGLDLIEQRLICWGGEPALDCVSLIGKPAA